MDALERAQAVVPQASDKVLADLPDISIAPANQLIALAQAEAMLAVAEELRGLRDDLYARYVA